MENKKINKELFLVVLVSFSLFILIIGCEEPEQEEPGLTPSTDSGPPSLDTTTPSEESSPEPEPQVKTCYYKECDRGACRRKSYQSTVCDIKSTCTEHSDCQCTCNVCRRVGFLGLSGWGCGLQAFSDDDCQCDDTCYTDSRCGGGGDYSSCYCPSFLANHCRDGYTKSGKCGSISDWCCPEEVEEEEEVEEVEVVEEEEEEGIEIKKINGRYITITETHPGEAYPSILNFYIGNSQEGKKAMTLLKFDLSNLEGKEIKKVNLVVNKVPMGDEETYIKQTTEVHKVTEKWNFDDTKWTNQPSFDTTIVDSQEIDEDGEYQFDITLIINYLISDNNGVLLKAQYENEPNLKRFDDAYLNVWCIKE